MVALGQRLAGGMGQVVGQMASQQASRRKEQWKRVEVANLYREAA